MQRRQKSRLRALFFAKLSQYRYRNTGSGKCALLYNARLECVNKNPQEGKGGAGPDFGLHESRAFRLAESLSPTRCNPLLSFREACDRLFIGVDQKQSVYWMSHNTIERKGLEVKVRSGFDPKSQDFPRTRGRHIEPGGGL